MRSFIYRNMLVVLLAVVFVVVATTYFVVSSNQGSEVVSQETEIQKLDTEVQSKTAQIQQAQTQAQDEALGTSNKRIDTDTAIIKDFMGTVSSWKSGVEYEAARSSVLRKYALDEKSQFMTVFFPETSYNTDSSGKRYYVIDTQGMNSTLGAVSVKPQGVVGTEYRYLVLADIRASSNDNKSSSSNTSAVYLTIDGEGKLSNVSAFASVSGDERSR